MVNIFGYSSSKGIYSLEEILKASASYEGNFFELIMQIS